MSEKSIDEMRAELEAAGIDYNIRILKWVPHSEGEKEIGIRNAYREYQREKQFQAMREYLIETYELILSRAGAEKKLSASPGVSFAACLPTANLLKLAALVDELKPDND